jgi:FkbH-like protein
MRMTVRERAFGEHMRCLQLINKTNQFNINGERVSEGDLRAILEQGGRLVGAALEDVNGSHGEVLAALIDASGTIQAFVMSCRVFQRRLEYAFLAWLSSRAYAPSRLRFAGTKRNEPARRFLNEVLAGAQPGLIQFDGKRLATDHAADLALFHIVDD